MIDDIAQGVQIFAPIRVDSANRREMLPPKTRCPAEAGHAANFVFVYRRAANLLTLRKYVEAGEMLSKSHAWGAEHV
jgi:hypothetical protein